MVATIQNKIIEAERFITKQCVVVGSMFHSEKHRNLFDNVLLCTEYVSLYICTSVVNLNEHIFTYTTDRYKC